MSFSDSSKRVGAGFSFVFNGKNVIKDLEEMIILFLEKYAQECFANSGYDRGDLKQGTFQFALGDIDNAELRRAGGFKILVDANLTNGSMNVNGTCVLSHWMLKMNKRSATFEAVFEGVKAQ